MRRVVDSGVVIHDVFGCLFSNFAFHTDDVYCATYLVQPLLCALLVLCYYYYIITTIILLYCVMCIMRNTYTYCTRVQSYRVQYDNYITAEGGNLVANLIR